MWTSPKRFGRDATTGAARGKGATRRFVAVVRSSRETGMELATIEANRAVSGRS
jgi:hypothetical protein